MAATMTRSPLRKWGEAMVAFSRATRAIESMRSAQWPRGWGRISTAAPPTSAARAWAAAACISSASSACGARGGDISKAFESLSISSASSACAASFFPLMIYWATEEAARFAHESTIQSEITTSSVVQ